MANIYHCKECGKESVASLCNTCFLDVLVSAVDSGKTDISQVLKGLNKKYGRLRNLKNLKVWKQVFGPQKIKKVITTETGERCRLVPTFDGWVALATEGEIRVIREVTLPEDMGYITAEGSRVARLPIVKDIVLPAQSTAGGRIITYYEGDVPIHSFKTPTSLVYTRKHSKREHRAGSTPPPGVRQNKEL